MTRQATQPPLPHLDFEPSTIGAALRKRSVADPNLEFVVSPTRRMTYHEAERASAHLAQRMLARGIGKGTRVGLYFDYSHEWVIAWLAATRIGALVMPLSTLYSPGELRRSIRLGDVHVLITGRAVAGRDGAAMLESAFAGLAEARSSQLDVEAAPYLRAVWLVDDAATPWAEHFPLEQVADERAVSPAILAGVEAEVTSSDLAVVVYTSGSSAEPKGVTHTQGALLWDSAVFPGMIRGYTGVPQPTVVCGMPFFWVGGLLVLSAALIEPLTVLIVPKFDHGQVLEIVEREKADYVAAWPTVIERLKAHPDFDSHDVSSVKQLRPGSVDIMAVGLPATGAPAHRAMSETMGTFAGVEIKVADFATGELVQLGDDGELCVRGPGLMAGYYKRDRADVFDVDGWYHSGDRVFQVAGDQRLFFRGRVTEMIKAAGANVAPREVELAMEESAPVRYCFVMGVSHPTRGEEVAAVVVAVPGDRLDEHVLKKIGLERLSAFKVPSTWVILDESEVPWLGSGKPDRVVLRRILEERVGART